MHNRTQILQKAEKKSESIEVRVPYSVKLSFMEKCSTNGDTASHVLRGSITDYLHPNSGHRQAIKLASTAMACLAIIASLSMSPLREMLGNRGSFAQQALFSIFDTNTDGYLTATDARDKTRPTLFALLESADGNEDGRLSKGEISALPTITIHEGARLAPPQEEASQARFLTLKLEGGQVARQLEHLKATANLSDSAIANIAQQISNIRQE